MRLPVLYPILDLSTLARLHPSEDLLPHLLAFARSLAEGGCTLIQYRAKNLNARQSLSHARELRRALPGVTLIMNDRCDLALAAGFDGVHLGQDDLSPAAARRLAGEKMLLGLSTHNAQQFASALNEPVDYLAIGPIFSTSTKADASPTVGLEVLAQLRAMTSRPLVAIGGITRANAASVLHAGADSVAVIGDLSASPRESARAFFCLMI